MKTQKLLVLGCSLFVGLTLIVLGVIAVGIGYLSRDPAGMVYELRQPGTVESGSEFQLEIQVANERSGRPLKISSIDVSEEYLNGFTVVSCEPAYTSSYTSFGSRTFEFDVAIPAGETNWFVFTLRSHRKGHYTGDVDVCEGVLLLTHVADTVVE